MQVQYNEVSINTIWNRAASAIIYVAVTIVCKRIGIRLYATR